MRCEVVVTATLVDIKALTTSGYAFMPRFTLGSSAIEAASLLGYVDSVEGLDAVQTLVPRKRDDAPPNTYSGIFGESSFPLHTDLAHWARPPRFLVLRCVRGAPSVGTRVLDGTSLIEHVGADSLRMALVQPRRPMRNGKQLLRLLHGSIDQPPFLLRWDRCYLRPASRIGSEVFHRVEDVLRDLSTATVVLKDAGDTLIVDNWRCLHGRSTVPATASDRHLERVYLKGLR